MALELSYQHKGTIIHQLDPRVRMLWWLAINIMLTTWNDPIFLFLLLVSIFIYGRIAGITIKQNLQNLVGGFLLGFMGILQYTFTMHILGFR